MNTLPRVQTFAAVLLSALAGTACESEPVNASASASEPHAAPAPASPAQSSAPASPAVQSPAVQSSAVQSSGGASVSRYGAALQPATTVPLATLLSNPKAYADQTVTTEGQVQRACSRKGCWMEIGAGADACRVTFKDYGFFVPTDSAGAFAKIQGQLDTREVEAAAVDHLESEGARFHSKKPDGSATEVRLIASAVELTR